jgi:hypothetical protein
MYDLIERIQQDHTFLEKRVVVFELIGQRLVLAHAQGVVRLAISLHFPRCAKKWTYRHI